MTDDGQQATQAIARAFKTLSDGLSKEFQEALEDGPTDRAGAKTAIRNHVPLW